jgi:hypothetical protein
MFGATDVAHASGVSSVLCDLQAGTDEPDGTSVAPITQQFGSLCLFWPQESTQINERAC